MSEMNKAFMNIQNSIPQILSRAIGTKFFLFLSLGTTLCLTSCDESSVVGLDVQPANDLLNVGWQDTTSLITLTTKADSLRSDGLLVANGVGLIGKYIDPIFGVSTASMYTQLRLPTNITTASNFGLNPVCDSLVLYLEYEGSSYGKRDIKPQKLNVYQLSADMSTTADYYSSNTISRYPLDITSGNAGKIFTPNPNDSVARIYMDMSLGQLLLNNGGSTTLTGNLSSDAAFRSFFKGLYITTENTSTLASNEGDIVSFKMGSSKLSIYYHNAATPTVHSHYDLALGSVARFNHFAHDYTSADTGIINQLSATPPTNSANVYIQSMAGLQTKVEFPYLMNWADSGAIGINKAELVIKADTSNPVALCDTFPPPTALIIFGIEDDGITTFPVPDAFEGSSYFGGTFNHATQSYTFNITRYVQQILDGKRKNNGIYIVASNGVLYANRVILGGGASSSGRQMKLNITYTKLH